MGEHRLPAFPDESFRVLTAGVCPDRCSVGFCWDTWRPALLLLCHWVHAESKSILSQLHHLTVVGLAVVFTFYFVFSRSDLWQGNEPYFSVSF